MSTSDTNKIKLSYVYITLIISIFGFVYEMFSHNVYSNYMLFAFTCPLIFGIMYLVISRFMKSVVSTNIYNSMCLTLTLYMITKGFLEIYGTTNTIVNVYLHILVALLILFVLSIIKDIKSNKKIEVL